MGKHTFCVVITVDNSGAEAACWLICTFPVRHGILNPEGFHSLIVGGGDWYTQSFEDDQICPSGSIDVLVLSKNHLLIFCSCLFDQQKNNPWVYTYQ